VALSRIDFISSAARGLKTGEKTRKKMIETRSYIMLLRRRAMLGAVADEAA